MTTPISCAESVSEQPRRANGRFVTKACPHRNCDGELRPERDGWWHCDGLNHEEPDGPLYACTHVFHPDYEEQPASSCGDKLEGEGVGRITPEWCARMAELEDGCEIGAGASAIPDMLLSMWARRHEISDREWREAGPVLLGIALSTLTARTPQMGDK